MEQRISDTHTDAIGKRVIKIRPSGGETRKPFKSGLKSNTVKAVVTHPMMLTPAYSFIEDDSIVECSRCKVIAEQFEYFALQELARKYADSVAPWTPAS